MFFDASNYNFWGSKPTTNGDKFHTNAEGMSLWQESNEIWLLKEIFQSFENSKVKLSTITCSLMLLIANSEVQNLHQKLKNFTNMLKACHSGK